jgi:cadmium resistance protein CadD (predicted permease)
MGFLTDTTHLANAVSTWMLGIIPVIAGLMLAYYAAAKMMNEGDPQIAMKSNHAMKNVIIAAVIGEAAMGVISGVTSYYADQTTSMLITHLLYFV